jgi:choline dehydrogenase
MPYVTNGNIYAPVMMIAERAADMALGATPAVPEHVPFYRHGRSGELREGPTPARIAQQTEAGGAP